MKISKKKFFLVSAYVVFLGFLAYGLYVAGTTTLVYAALKNKTRGWRGRVHQYDPVLGFAPIPGAQGWHTFPLGPDIPMRYNKEGFRVPVYEDIDPEKRPLFLFLGCSYTYGDACRADEVFAYLTAKHFNGTAINAGVCGYGLAQMLLLARQLIPEYRPDFVIVQSSRWLVNRATREFSPTYFARIPYPYFTDSGEGFALAPPVYRTDLFDQDLSRYRSTPKGLADYCSFMVEAAIPLKVSDDVQYAVFLIKKVFGFTPKPTKRMQEARDFFYSQVSKLCREYFSHMIVVGLRDSSYAMSPDLNYVDAEEGLRKNLGPKGEYAKTYAHWRGDPPVKVDNHPNPLAHKIIAAQIIEKIEALLKQPDEK